MGTDETPKIMRVCITLAVISGLVASVDIKSPLLAFTVLACGFIAFKIERYVERKLEDDEEV